MDSTSLISPSPTTRTLFVENNDHHSRHNGANVAEYLAKLSSKARNVQEEAAEQLVLQINSMTYNLTSETISRNVHEINRRIHELIHSVEPHERLGAVLAIYKLAEKAEDEMLAGLPKYANFIRVVLPGKDIGVMVEAAKALGKLVERGGTFALDLVDYETHRIYEWMEDRTEQFQAAAVLITKTLLEASPYYMIEQLESIVTMIIPNWFESKFVSVQEFGARMIAALVELLKNDQTSEQVRSDCFNRLKSYLHTNFKNSMFIVSSLLLLQVLSEKSSTELAKGELQIFFEYLFKLLQSRDAQVRSLLPKLIPSLAKLNPELFVSEYLISWTGTISDGLKRDKDRLIYLEALSKTADALGARLCSELGGIFSVLNQILMAKAKHKVSDDEDGVFVCISNLANHCGDALFGHIKALLPAIISNELSPQLRATLLSISVHVSGTMPFIQDPVLDAVSRYLCKASISDSLMVGSTADSRVSVILALETLASFEFTEPILDTKLGSNALKLLQSKTLEVRLTSARALTQLASCNSKVQSYESFLSVDRIVDALLKQCIADSDENIRNEIIKLIRWGGFEKHLIVNGSRVIMLVSLLAQGNLNSRLVVADLLSNMGSICKGILNPHIRMILQKLLADLKSHDRQIAEDSAVVLSRIVYINDELIDPYVEPLLRNLLPKISESNAITVSAILNTLNRLIKIDSSRFTQDVNILLDAMVDILQDLSSSQRRQAALNCLCTLIRHLDRHIILPNRFTTLILQLVELLKIELLRPVRNDILLLFGVIGAIDPYRMKSREIELLTLSESLAIVNTAHSPNDDIIISGAQVGSDEYFSSVAVNALLKVLRDPSLSSNHLAATQALLVVLKFMGSKSRVYLGQVLTILYAIIRSCSQQLLDFYFYHLAMLVSIAGVHARPVIDELVSLVQEFWSPTSPAQLALLSLVETMMSASRGERHASLYSLIPMIISLLPISIPDRTGLCQKTMLALVAAGPLLEDYTSSLIHVLMNSVVADPKMSRDIYLCILQSLYNLVMQLSFTSSSTELARLLALILETGDLELCNLVEDILIVMSFYDSNALYIPMLLSIAEKHGIQLKKITTLKNLDKCQQYNLYSAQETISSLFSTLSSNLQPTNFGVASFSHSFSSELSLSTSSLPQKYDINEQNLRRSWDSYGCVSKEDWFEWIRRLGVELLKESPSPALRACSVLAALNYPLARELFNAAFVSCWSELDNQMQTEFVGFLEVALASPTVPPEATQILLNLAEFLEHEDRSLPIDISTLGAYAIKCHAFAKALYYKELEFQVGTPTPALVESLISINSQIQLPDAAVGILVSAQKHYGITLKETWYEKLQRWDDALVAYQRKWSEDPNSVETLLGIFRCQHALGDWDTLAETAAQTWPNTDEEGRIMMAPLAAVATWGLERWKEMTEYVKCISPTSPEGSFFRSVLAINSGDFDEANRRIVVTRELIDAELTTMVSESYSRAYNTVVRVQMLAELEEVILFTKGTEDKKAIIKRCWEQRLEDCQENVDIWQRILKIRSLVLQPQDNVEVWIKFSNLCSRSGRPLLARRVLLSLLHTDDRNLDHLDLAKALPVLVYAFLKHNWELGEREKALKFMRLYSKLLAQRLDQLTTDISGTTNKHIEEQSKLLARCYVKLAEWQKTVSLEKGEEMGSTILDNYLAATSYDKSWYKAWHGWALTNFELAALYERSKPLELRPKSNPYVVPAVHGFFRSIALASGNGLQDALRLLTLWFKYGVLPEVNAAVGDGIYAVPVDSWLQVLPQLIARIHVPSPQVRRLIHQVLSDIGRHHPQALVYPLTVSSKSQNVARKTSALAILDKMRSHSARLVEQAVLVSQELIRIAILWEEHWHEALEEASKLYFGDQDVAGMLSLLEPLHQILERQGYETQREASFVHAYGKELKEARELCQRYKKSSNTDDINAAWDIYYQVFRKISKLLPQMSILDLEQCSPRLLAAKDLELAVPGTYRAAQPVTRIASVSSSLSIISSKQRPRKLTIIGSDGERYKFLLKGHEDLRQDERVMQLFRLVNTLLENDPETYKRHLAIQRFTVVPLSQNTGLIGWVPHCDTLHTLIKDYRETRGVLLSVEHRIMLQFAPDYDHLTLLQKVEAFDFAMKNTDGRDLARIQWKRSRNAEAWLDRRTTFTRSLAVMSMVGYVLGLGDRHPSNLMIDQLTGRIVHIDFGDCFEVAMQRDRYPECVPFRLTRMLVKAMEASEIEGTFRITCEHTMRVLRDSRDSVMAVLEAFVYDPLINWRLLAAPSVLPAVSKPGISKLGAESGYSNMDAIESTGQYPESFSSSRKMRKLGEINRLEEESINRPEVLNAGAVNVINRVSNKLTGRDFKVAVSLNVAEQVDKLIQQAMEVENLCQAYVGWCPFW